MSNFLTSTATFMSPALSVAPSAGSTIFTLLSALSPQPATVADARTTTATTPATNCPRGRRKFHTALLLIQAATTYFVPSCRVPNSNRYAPASEAACNLLSLITVRRQQLSDSSALLLMDTLGVVSHSRLARL